MGNASRDESLDTCKSELRSYLSRYYQNVDMMDSPNVEGMFVAACRHATHDSRLALPVRPHYFTRDSQSTRNPAERFLSASEVLHGMGADALLAGQVLTEEQIRDLEDKLPLSPSKTGSGHQHAVEHLKKSLAQQIDAATTVDEVLAILGPQHGPLAVALQCAALTHEGLSLVLGDKYTDYPDFGSHSIATCALKVLALLEAARLLRDSITSEEHLDETAPERDRLVQLLKSYHSHLAQHLSAYVNLRDQHVAALREIATDIDEMRQEDTRRANYCAAVGLIATAEDESRVPPEQITVARGRRRTSKPETTPTQWV